MCGEPKSKHALIQKRSEIKQKNKFFLTESKKRFTLKFFTVLKSRVERKSRTLV